MNDNDRAPAAHRRIVEQQAENQPRGAPRPYRSARWPQAERLQHDIGGKDMIAAMVDWRKREGLPIMCVANDNYKGENADIEAGESVREEHRFDNIMDTDSADYVLAKFNRGKSWRPEDERFDRPRRNDRAKAAPGPGQYKVNGVEYHQREADAEDELNGHIDHKNTKRRMGPIACHMMTLASSDSTTEEIAKAFKQPMSPRIETYIDWAVISYMREAA